MRLVLVLVLGIVLIASVVAASGDHFRKVTRVGTWGSGSGDPIVVEEASYSQQADGADLRTSWSIEQPAGKVQAVISDPYSRTPTIKMQPKSTVSKDAVDKLRARLVELAKQKPAPKQAERWKALASSEGLTELKGAQCPKEVRMKIGTKRLMLWSGKTGYDLGSSQIKGSQCGDISWTLGENTATPVAPPRCFAHAGGYLVRVQLHHGCEGDYYVDRFAYVAAP